MNFPASSKKEAETILAYMMSPLFKFVASSYNKTSGFTPFVKNSMVPDLRGKKWTDKALYKHFGLTPEEIAYVEANVK